jgi:hypothetical protein
MKQEVSNADYSTILNIYTSDDRFIFVNNPGKMLEYKNKLLAKIWLTDFFFKLWLLFEIIIHTIYFHNTLNSVNDTLNNFTPVKEKLFNTSVCAFYLIQIFSMLGYLVLRILTLISAKDEFFKIFEAYILVMIFSDVLFSFFNSYNVLFMFEGFINYLAVKYLRFLHKELNKVNI